MHTDRTTNTQRKRPCLTSEQLHNYHGGGGTNPYIYASIFILIISGLILILGGVGTIEHSTDSTSFCYGIGISLLGLLLLGAGAVLSNCIPMEDHNDY